MTKNLWIATLVAAILVIISLLTWRAGVSWIPSILMFLAALTVMGVSMMEEDVLLEKYDTPHDEDKHPPALIAWRFGRALVLFVMAVMIFVMAF